LFADADGATPIEEEVRLADAVAGGADVAIGSRLLPSRDMQRRRRPLRGLAGRLFAALARRWMRLSILDTQCGFKMFRAEAGRRLFGMSRESGYLFDIEILVLAARLGYRVEEVAIHWHEVPGGNVHLARDLPRVARDLWNLRRRLTEDL
jgi:dolichyl-phosphate beta-glucosyltransferase